MYKYSCMKYIVKESSEAILMYSNIFAMQKASVFFREKWPWLKTCGWERYSDIIYHHKCLDSLSVTMAEREANHLLAYQAIVILAYITNERNAIDGFSSLRIILESMPETFGVCVFSSYSSIREVEKTFSREAYREVSCNILAILQKRDMKYLVFFLCSWRENVRLRRRPAYG